MRNNLALNLIYRYESIEENGALDSIYRVVYFFSEAGMIARENLDRIYEDVVGKPTFGSYIFSNLDKLGEFALKVCIDQQSPEVFVLSVQDYNTGMESVRDLRSFREVFRRFGNCLNNPDTSFEKSGIFSNIFKR